jgi:hypothetical protein
MLFLVALLLTAAVGLQAMQARRPPLGLPSNVTGNLLYVQSPEFMKRAALSYDALIADAYWVRTVQHYGGTKLSRDEHKQYDLLYPMLDLTTSLDPYFDIAYRFGAVFLAEPFPSGAGRPDRAIALLEKGLRAQPHKWQLEQDIGFVYYWTVKDYSKASAAFNRAGDMPGAPSWLKAIAAVTLAQGGNRASSRVLWTQIMNTADADWLRDQAKFRLSQLDAMDQIAALERAVADYRARSGSAPASWRDLIRAGMLRGFPIDSTRHPFQLIPGSGKVTLAPDSPLNPLPEPDRPA